MNGSSGELREARELWRRAGSAAPRGGGTPCPGELELAAYLDGRAPEGSAALVEEHLRTCPDCLAAVAELRALLRAGPSPAPAGVAEAAKELVAAATSASGPLATLGRLFAPLRTGAAWAAAAAVVVAACAAGFIMGQETFSVPDAGESRAAPEGEAPPNPVAAELFLLEKQYLRGDPS